MVEVTDRKVWVVGKWYDNTWRGCGVFRDYSAADKFCGGYGLDYSIQRMYELVSDDDTIVSPQSYWMAR